MEIRGRLDFIDKLLAEEIKKNIEQYKASIDSGKIEAAYLEYGDLLCGHEGVSDAFIQIAMYGQFTMVNHCLLSNIRNLIFKNYDPLSLKMIYRSYSMLLKGSKISKELSLRIEQKPEGISVEYNPDAPPLDIKEISDKIKALEPKSNPNEFFRIGRHPKFT